MNLRPIFQQYEPGCSCPAIEYDNGSVRVIPQPECMIHKRDFPPPPPTERERYEAAMRGDIARKAHCRS